MFANIDANFLYTHYLKNKATYGDIFVYLHSNANQEDVRLKCNEIKKYVKHIFEIAYFHARNGQLSLNEQISKDQILKKLISPFHDTNLAITEIFLRNIFDIKLNIIKEIDLEWRCDNEFLNPKPTFKANIKDHIKLQNFESLFEDQRFSDFTIENVISKTHNIINFIGSIYSINI